MTVYADLHRDCAALGTILFTVTLHDPAAALVRRAYSSAEDAYPVTGTKPLGHDDFTDQVLGRGEVFVAARVEDFPQVFPDADLIAKLGCRSCVNLPIVKGAEVLGTVNLLAGEDHFTPERIRSYMALLAQHREALLAEIAARPLG